MGVEPTWVGYYIGVDDVPAAAERVAPRGGAVQVPPTDVADISRYSVVTDPQRVGRNKRRALRYSSDRAIAC
jgi:predicted enzyme related to lactoylglutathione lyase